MKTTRTKHRFFLRLVAAILFLSSSAPSFGQEITRDAANFLCDTSIIRSLAGDASLICDRTTRSSFTMMPGGAGVVPPPMFLDSFLVNDFEVMGNMVYFCGYKMVDGKKKGAFGHFDLVTFPISTVFYYATGSYEEMRKIDVYELNIQFQYETHLVMTGTTTGGRSDALLDMNLSVPYGINCQAYVSNEENEIFDDVAVTKNNVVVSVRKEAYGFPVIDFWQFPQPTTLGSFILSSGFDRLRLASPVVETPVFLEHTANDKFAAVSKVNGFNRMVFMKPDVLTNTCKIVEIYGDELKTLIPMDIKYNTKGKVYDILARRYRPKDSVKYDPPMRIYHVTAPVINGYAPYGEGIWYPDHSVWSIDPKNNPQNDMFVASGSWGGTLSFFRYWHNQWVKCPERFEYDYAAGEVKMSLETDELSPKNHIIKEHEYETRDWPNALPVKCEEIQ